MVIHINSLDKCITPNLQFSMADTAGKLAIKLINGVDLADLDGGGGYEALHAPNQLIFKPM